MTPEVAIARARRRYRLVERPSYRSDGPPCWVVLDRSNSGNGIYGDAEAGRNHYEKTIMFRALRSIDPKHDWHEYDWHTLTGAAEDRVARMLAWRKESDAAAAEVAGIHALIALTLRGSGSAAA